MLCHHPIIITRFLSILPGAARVWHSHERRSHHRTGLQPYHRPDRGAGLLIPRSSVPRSSALPAVPQESGSGSPAPVRGPGIPDNAIRAASRAIPAKAAGGCTSGKGSGQKTKSHGLRKASTRKLLYDLHDKRGTLNVDKKELGRTMCPGCDLKPRCVEAGTVEKLIVYCLEGVFHG